MKIYLVGGAVRDTLLSKPIQDRDWVVVGSTQKEMLDKGFEQVGKSFSVFLHPETGEEYALAQTSLNFELNENSDSYIIALQDDLIRRDLTINAMAIDSNGNLIDPFGGKKDLENGVLRHVCTSTFSEDPLRVLRVARFAARYGFNIAKETMDLMKKLVSKGQLNNLAGERVWKELSRGLMETNPRRMIEVMRECGALKAVLPEVDTLFGIPQPEKYHPEIDTGIHTLMVLESATQSKLSLEERYSALLHDVGKGKTPVELLPKHHGHEEAGVEPVKNINKRLRVNKECFELSQIVTKWHGTIHKVFELSPQKILQVLKQTDSIRRPERFVKILNVCAADKKGRLGFENTDYPQHQAWIGFMNVVNTVDCEKISNELKLKEQSHLIPEKIHQARIHKIKQFKKSIQP